MAENDSLKVIGVKVQLAAVMDWCDGAGAVARHLIVLLMFSLNLKLSEIVNTEVMMVI